MGHEPGERVGAISHSDKDTVYLFGYGIYEGDFVRDSGPGLFGVEVSVERAQLEEIFTAEYPSRSSAEMKTAVDDMLKNPRIKLDSGKTVWGCQCWWGTEEKVLASIGSRQVVIVDIEEQVRKASADGGDQ